MHNHCNEKFEHFVASIAFDHDQKCSSRNWPTSQLTSDRAIPFLQPFVSLYVSQLANIFLPPPPLPHTNSHFANQNIRK